MSILFSPNRFLLITLLIIFSSQSILHAKPKIKTKAVKHLFDITKVDGKLLSAPTDVMAVGNKIYILDGDNNRVLVLNEKGKFILSFGSKGKKKGQFYSPVGLHASKNGDIYVADTRNYRIQKFDATGKHLLSFDSVNHNRKNTKAKPKKVRPVDITVHEKTKEIYVSNKGHSVVVYNKKGKKIRGWGGNGKQNSLFRYPGSIINLTDNRIAVVDILNTRVQIFRNKGSFSYQISSFGVQPGQLIRPKGVAVSSDENIYISDSYMDVIQVFSSSGKFRYVLGAKGKPHRFVSATGISINKNTLYVAEPFENKVAVYKLQ